MKTIIAATDFSKVATNAAIYAKDMAEVLGADLLLVHIWRLPVNYGEMAVAITADDILEDARKNIFSLQEQLTSYSNGKITIRTKIRMGEFFKELEDICETIKPYTVIMGSQGSTAAERVIFGGHTVHAMKNLQWPLITVPPGVSFNAIKKIGLACDFDNVVDTIPVDEIKSLVKDFNAGLHIINTGKKERLTFSPELVFESGMLQEMIRDIKPDYHFITHENTDEGIIDFAEKNNIDLLIILPKRHGLLDKLVHKSHTKQLVLHSHVPVMALHE